MKATVLTPNKGRKVWYYPTGYYSDADVVQYPEMRQEAFIQHYLWSSDLSDTRVVLQVENKIITTRTKQIRFIE